MTNYPPGSDTPDSPWNEPKPKMIECPDCGGDGTISHSDGDDWDEFNCTTCDGTGEIEDNEEKDNFIKPDEQI